MTFLTWFGIMKIAQGNPTSYLGHTLTWEKGRLLKKFDNIEYTYNANGIRTSKAVNGRLGTSPIVLCNPTKCEVIANHQGAYVMKKCPVCNQTFTWRMLLHRKFSQSFPNLLGEHLTDGKGVIRCPHCGSRLRKKISFIFFLH